MVSFVDKNGVKKVIELTIGGAKRIKAKFGIDLVNPIEMVDGKTAFERIVESPLLLCDILFEMLVEAGKSEDKFADCLNGETIQRGYDAFMEEIVNFSLPQTKAILKTLIQTAEEVGQKQMEELEKAKPEIGRQLAKLQV